MTEYKSSVLTCDIEEDGCAVCEFLSGNRDQDTLLETIRILDVQLARKESLCDTLQDLVYQPGTEIRKPYVSESLN